MNNEDDREPTTETDDDAEGAPTTTETAPPEGEQATEAAEGEAAEGEEGEEQGDESTDDGGEDPMGEHVAQILGHVGAIGARLERVEETFVARFRSDDKLQTAFDRLYEEMQQYKENFLFQAQKPLLIDLILLYDQMQTAMETVEDEGAKNSIDMICEQLLEVMYRRDVEPMEFDPDEAFDREKMKAVKRLTTEDQAEDKTVERLVRTGFAWNERVLRPHEVVVKRFKQS